MKPSPLASLVLVMAMNVAYAQTVKPAVVASATASAPIFVAPQAKPMGDRAYLDTLEGTNTFDSQRKLWPDKRPPAPPPPPPPPPPPIADQDLQLYGVLIVGTTKRATVKVSSRFAYLDAAGRGFVTISEGQALGDWRLAEIQPTRLVLSPLNGSPSTQAIIFTKKTDRFAAPSSISAPMERPMPTALAPGNDAQPPQANNGATPPGTVPNTAAAAGTPAAANPAANSAQPNNQLSNSPTNSLAAAIAAAQAAAQANPAPNPSGAAANFNPFLQLFKKQ